MGPSFVEELFQHICDRKLIGWMGFFLYFRSQSSWQCAILITKAWKNNLSMNQHSDYVYLIIESNEGDKKLGSGVGPKQSKTIDTSKRREWLKRCNTSIDYQATETTKSLYHLKTIPLKLPIHFSCFFFLSNGSQLVSNYQVPMDQ